MLKVFARIAAAFFALLAAGLFCSCDPVSQTGTAKTLPSASVTSSELTDEIPDVETALVTDGECLWRVVRPEVCSETVLQAARSIDIHLFNRFEIHLENKNDLASPVSKEILVGLTNRPESQEVFSTLAENSYAVKEVNGKIVIIGENDRATAKAVEVFLSTWVDHAAKPSEGEKAQVPMSIGEGKSGKGPL